MAENEKIVVKFIRDLYDHRPPTSPAVQEGASLAYEVLTMCLGAARTWTVIISS